MLNQFHSKSRRDDIFVATCFSPWMTKAKKTCRVRVIAENKNLDPTRVVICTVAETPAIPRHKLLMPGNNLQMAHNTTVIEHPDLKVGATNIQSLTGLGIDHKTKNENTVIDKSRRDDIFVATGFSPWMTKAKKTCRVRVIAENKNLDPTRVVICTVAETPAIPRYKLLMRGNNLQMAQNPNTIHHLKVAATDVSPLSGLLRKGGSMITNFRRGNLNTNDSILTTISK